MTVPTDDNREDFNGNDSATSFTCPFKIFEATDATVILVDAQGGEATLVLNTDYTLSGVGAASGFTVNYPISGDPLATGERLVVLREVPLVQNTDLRNQGAYFPENVEDEFDRLTMMTQQLNERLNRSLTFSPGASTGISAQLPPAQALQFFRWNAAGTALEGVSGTQLVGEVAYSNFNVDTYNSGTDFTPGTTTSLTMTGNPLVKANTQVYFDGSYQEKEDYNITGTTITFTSAIPIGTSKVEILFLTPTEITTIPAINPGDAGRIMRVNATETGFELIAHYVPDPLPANALQYFRQNAAGDNYELVAGQLPPVPAAGAADALKIARVNSAGDAIEYVAPQNAASLGYDFIGGLQLSVASTTSVSVAAGAARGANNNGNMNLAAAIAKSINVAWAQGNGQGGLASALSLTANTWYYVFLIGRPDGVVDAGYDTSATAANLLADATGFTFYRAIGEFFSNASSQVGAVIDFRELGRGKYSASFSSSGTFYVPRSVSVVDVRICGGGGSGSRQDGSFPGTNGGNSSFGGLVAAGGAGGAVSGGVANAGQDGFVSDNGGRAGKQNGERGIDGSGGRIVFDLVTVAGGSSVAVTIGAGGAASTGGTYDAGDGGDGHCFVKY